MPENSALLGCRLASDMASLQDGLVEARESSMQLAEGMQEVTSCLAQLRFPQCPSWCIR